MKNLVLIAVVICLSATISFAQGLTYINGYQVGSSLAIQSSCVTSYFGSWPRLVRVTIEQYNNSGSYEFASGVEDGFSDHVTYCPYTSNTTSDPTGPCSDCQTWEWEP